MRENRGPSEDARLLGLADRKMSGIQKSTLQAHERKSFGLQQSVECPNSLTLTMGIGLRTRE